MSVGLESNQKYWTWIKTN